MKMLTLLLTSSLYVGTGVVILNTDVIEKERQVHRELLSMELNIRDAKRLNLLKQRDNKPRRTMKQTRLKRIYIYN